MKIKDHTGKEQSEGATIAAYFRKTDGSETVSQFFAQLKELTPEAKTELAIGAAKELKWTIE